MATAAAAPADARPAPGPPRGGRPHGRRAPLAGGVLGVSAPSTLGEWHATLGALAGPAARDRTQSANGTDDAIDLRALAQPRAATLPALPEFGAGDTVRVQARVVEGDRERLQPFEGIVIRVKNGPAGNFTVRRIASGIGVER